MNDFGAAERVVCVPGRVNLVGEHIDYHDLAVLPMAIERRVTVRYGAAGDSMVEAESEGYGARQFDLREAAEPNAAGDWANYLKAAAQAIGQRWPITRGLRAHVSSDLPSAAGLSSSTALLTAFTLALLDVNGIEPRLAELMEILPEGEQYVGTRGGGMDHAAVLASRAGHASLIRFAPFGVDAIAIPDGWRFLIAHSLTRAEKSGPAKARYNACRYAGARALTKLALASYQEALAERAAELPALGSLLNTEERDAFEHVTSEARRVEAAVAALRADDRRGFGELLQQSHASLRDRLRVSCPALDRVTEIAVRAGADGARLTGAGFGGCAIVLCAPEGVAAVEEALEREFYADQPQYERAAHLLRARAANGALAERVC